MASKKDRRKEWKKCWKRWKKGDLIGTSPDFLRKVAVEDSNSRTLASLIEPSSAEVQALPLVCHESMSSLSDADVSTDCSDAEHGQDSFDYLWDPFLPVLLAFLGDVAEDLPVVEKRVEEEVTAEPEDGASAEHAYDEHAPADQIVQGLSHEEGQTLQEFAKDVAEDLPVVEKRVEEEVTAEPEDGASAEQAQVQEDLQERVEGLQKLVQDLQVKPRESDQEKLEKTKSNPDLTEELATLRHRDTTQKELLGRLKSKLEVQSQKAAECEAALEEANTIEKKDFGALLASLQTEMRELKAEKADTAALMKLASADGVQSGPDVRPDATDTQDPSLDEQATASPASSNAEIVTPPVTPEALVLDHWIQIEVLEITRDQENIGRQPKHGVRKDWPAIKDKKRPTREYEFYSDGESHSEYEEVARDPQAAPRKRFFLKNQKQPRVTPC